MNTLQPYTFGSRLALERCLGKTAAATPGSFSFFDRLTGKNVQAVLDKHVEEIMSDPALVSLGQRHAHIPDALSTIRTYVQKALRSGEIPSVKGVEGERARKIHKRLTQLLSKGTENVQAEQRGTRNLRLGVGGAALVPVVGGAALTKSSAEDDALGTYAPPIAGGAVGLAPLAQGISSGALRRPEMGGQEFKNIADLQAKMQAGDIVLVGTPDMYSTKALVMATGGDPHGYHVETVEKAPKPGAKYLDVTHSTPASGGAASELESLQGDKDFIVRRFRDAAHRAEFLKNIEAMRERERLLSRTLGEDAQRAMYDTSHGLKIGLKDLLPKILRERLASKPCPPGSTVCSTLPAMASPVPLDPKIPANEILPHHIQQSEALETIGRYYAPRSKAIAASESALRAVPYAARGLLGAGLGLGTYYGLKKLMGQS